MNWFTKVLKNYAGFSGRARRKEYWMFSLFQLIFIILAWIADMILGTPMILYFLYVLGTFIPSLAVTVRRLHDTNKSGWFILISLIPIIGSIWLLVLMCTDSDPGDNQYGPNPKGLGPENAIPAV